jgi:hypothetical protein
MRYSRYDLSTKKREELEKDEIALLNKRFPDKDVLELSSKERSNLLIDIYPELIKEAELERSYHATRMYGTYIDHLEKVYGDSGKCAKLAQAYFDLAAYYEKLNQNLSDEFRLAISHYQTALYHGWEDKMVVEIKCAYLKVRQAGFINPFEYRKQDYSSLVELQFAQGFLDKAREAAKSNSAVSQAINQIEENLQKAIAAAYVGSDEERRKNYGKMIGEVGKQLQVLVEESAKINDALRTSFSSQPQAMSSSVSSSIASSTSPSPSKNATLKTKVVGTLKTLGGVAVTAFNSLYGAITTRYSASTSLSSSSSSESSPTISSSVAVQSNISHLQSQAEQTRERD